MLAFCSPTTLCSSAAIGLPAAFAYPCAIDTATISCMQQRELGTVRTMGERIVNSREACTGVERDVADAQPFEQLDRHVTAVSRHGPSPERSLGALARSMQSTTIS